MCMSDNNKLNQVNKQIGNRLAEVRRLINMDQKPIAKACIKYYNNEVNFNQSLISSYENGGSRASSLYLKFLAEKHNINSNYILTGKGHAFIDTSVHNLVVATKAELVLLENDLQGVLNRINVIRRR